MIAIVTKTVKLVGSMGIPWLEPCAKYTGFGFAGKFKDSDKLCDVLHKLDVASLSQLHNDHDAGHLERKIKSHS